MKYQIGQEVWWASFESEPAYVTCPDCGGTRHIRCILFDGAEVTIDCEGCSRGYDLPTGRILVCVRKPAVREVVIAGVDIEPDRVEYKVATGQGIYHLIDESALFVSVDMARTYAADLAAEADRAERERISQKEKPTKSWAWHVHYHRREIREAEKRIAYHSSKLAVAKTHKTTEAA